MRLQTSRLFAERQLLFPIFNQLHIESKIAIVYLSYPRIQLSTMADPVVGEQPELNNSSTVTDAPPPNVGDDSAEAQDIPAVTVRERPTKSYKTSL